MRSRRVLSPSEMSSYPRGKSNTRIHEANAAGLEKETPSFILALGGLLDDAVKCNMGSEMQKSIKACDDGPEVNRETLSTSREISDDRRDSPQLFTKSLDEYSDETSRSWDGSRELQQAPTSKRRGVMCLLHRHFGTSSDSEERDDDSMSRSVDTGTTELYDTGHRRADSMSSEDCMAQMLRSVSSEASVAERAGGVSSKVSVKKLHRGLSSEASVAQIGRLRGSDVSVPRDGSYGTTSELGALSQMALDRKASVELLKPFTEPQCVLPAESSIDPLQCLSRISEIAFASADNLHVRSEVMQDKSATTRRRRAMLGAKREDSRSPLISSGTRTSLGGYSKTKKGRYGLVPEDLVTIQCSKVVKEQTQGENLGTPSSQRHSTTVAGSGDGRLTDNFIEVFFENQDAGKRRANRALQRPSWQVQLEHQSLRILCKALSLGSAHVKNAHSKYFTGWFSPRRGRC